MIKWVIFSLFVGYLLFRLIRGLLRISGFIYGISDNTNQDSINRRIGKEKDITDKVRRMD